MILTCPSCGTRYTVADNAIPPEGRQVRCASCKHRWHQDGEGTAPAAPGSATLATGHPPVDDTAPASVATTHAHPDTPPSPADYCADPDAHPLPSTDAPVPQASTLASDGEGRGYDEGDEEPRQTDFISPDPQIEAAPTEATMPEPLAAAADPAAEQWADAAQDDQNFSHDARYDRYGEPRSRGPLMLLIGLGVIAAIAAALWFLAPVEWRQRLGLATNTDTPLLLQVEQHSRQQLASGNQLLEVSGRVINPTDSAQKVPPLQAQLRSLEQKVVYKWTIPPPAQVLAPGGSASFNSAELNIPAAAACLDVSFGKLKDQQPCRAANATSTRAS